MSDDIDEPHFGPTHPTVPVTVNIPEGKLRDYDGDVERSLYADREAALLDALVEGGGITAAATRRCGSISGSRARRRRALTPMSISRRRRRRPRLSGTTRADEGE
jgi:hypothetical protein